MNGIEQLEMGSRVGVEARSLSELLVVAHFLVFLLKKFSPELVHNWYRNLRHGRIDISKFLDRTPIHGGQSQTRQNPFAWIHTHFTHRSSIIVVGSNHIETSLSTIRWFGRISSCSSCSSELGPSVHEQHRLDALSNGLAKDKVSVCTHTPDTVHHHQGSISNTQCSSNL